MFRFCSKVRGSLKETKNRRLIMFISCLVRAQVSCNKAILNLISSHSLLHILLLVLNVFLYDVMIIRAGLLRTPLFESPPIHPNIVPHPVSSGLPLLGPELQFVVDFFGIEGANLDD